MAYITELEFLDGSKVAMPRNGITLVVGPNNAGKTVLLREIAALLSIGPHDSAGNLLTLSRVDLRKNGSYRELVRWLEERGVRGRRPNNLPQNPVTFYTGQQQIQEPMLQRSWDHPNGLGQAATLLVSHQTTESRLQQVGSGVGVHNLETDEPGHPLQQLWADATRESAFTKLFRRAFGHELSINRYVSTIDLKIGRPTLPLTPPPPSRELLAEYSSLPSVSEQGDGVRSFTGLLLHAIVPTTTRIILIDEPEAFLHSPQARLLAQYLTEHAPSDTQLILATHSQDIVQGVINAAGARDVQIVRLTRGKDGPPNARVLPPQLIAELARDTFLQHSNVLNGLFHDGVILCEADADCSYYSLVASTTFAGQRLPDIMFTQVAGKSRVAPVTQKLRSLDIPVAAIVDFDVLAETTVLRAMVEAAGGDFQLVDEDLAVVQASVEAPAGPTVAQLRRALNVSIEGLANGDRLDSARSRPLRDALRATTGWNHLKRAGLRGLEAGGPYEAAVRVLDRLQALGIFVVPVGELERWHPEVPRKSNEWLGTVIESKLHLLPDTERAAFVRSLVTFLADASGRQVEPLGAADPVDAR